MQFLMREPISSQPLTNAPMQLHVVGAGYVGLVSAAAFAKLGHHVVCADIDAARIDMLNAGGVPIYEPGLAELISAGREAGRLCFVHGLGEALCRAQMVLIAVGTPPRPDGRADISYVLESVRQIAPYLASDCLVVTKSTVPVGTGDLIEHILTQHRPDHRIHVASNPEFLREGNAISDFLDPDRIVVGVSSTHAQRQLRRVYEPLLAMGVPFMATGRRTAELIKHASNSLLATKLGFINEMADLCERVGADIIEVSRGMGLDHRIGPAFLNAGPGFGGSCFPKDALALINTANDHGMALPIIERVVHANDMRKRNIARKVLAALGGSVQGKTIGILGLAFKPCTDDMREAPAIEIIQALDYWGANTKAYDPAAMAQARLAVRADHLSFAQDPYEAAADADAVVLVTEWSQFSKLDLPRLAKSMRRAVLIDLRNAIDPIAARAAGFVHIGIGRGDLPEHRLSGTHDCLPSEPDMPVARFAGYGSEAGLTPRSPGSMPVPGRAHGASDMSSGCHD